MMEESLEYRTKTLNDLEDCHQRLLALVEELSPAFNAPIPIFAVA